MYTVTHSVVCDSDLWQSLVLLQHVCSKHPSHSMYCQAVPSVIWPWPFPPLLYQVCGTAVHACSSPHCDTHTHTHTHTHHHTVCIQALCAYLFCKLVSRSVCSWRRASSSPAQGREENNGGGGGGGGGGVGGGGGGGGGGVGGVGICIIHVYLLQ